MDISVASSEARLDLKRLPDPSAGGTSGRAWHSIRETGRKLAAHVRLRTGPFSIVDCPFAVENGPFGLLAKLNHEIRTPLNAIIGFSELFLMHRPTSPDQARALVENVHASGQRLLAILEAILGDCDPPFDIAALEKRPLNVRHALSEVFTMLEAKIRRSGCMCVLLADEDLIVDADSAAFSEMLVALLSCVLGRAVADSLIIVSAQRDKANSFVEVRCKDLGGHSHADEDRVRRALVSALALAHGGRLTIEQDDTTALLARLTFFATSAVA